ncbi:hypothetical protein K461DRAFT_139706 [Myriangium duriaei CBS 260.36]|uniref:Secreted protein n=1 Tax=Myriangium duriaei CBS 260.36 TaxID=1168546 RepID=A0A9P4MN54_9PEZI|nr:hypothetical protein K461DRAFT_139706 [Myriangium duriaei CBS 260.36]
MVWDGQQVWQLLVVLLAPRSSAALNLEAWGWGWRADCKDTAGTDLLSLCSAVAFRVTFHARRYPAAAELVVRIPVQND